METGKAYTIADDKGPKQLLISQKEGVFLSQAYTEAADNKNKIFGKVSSVMQSKKGDYLILASEKRVMVYSLIQHAPVTERQFNYIHSITLSSAETYLQVLDKISVNEGKTILFSFPAMKEVAEYKEDQFTGYFNKQHFPLIRFSSDDSRYFRYNKKLIEVYDGKHQKINQIQTGVLQFFQVSKISKLQQYFLVTIYLDKKTNQGKCQIFTQKLNKQAIYSKQIKKAQQIKIKFSPISNCFLMQLQTYFDPTGKSYYGEFGLFIYNDVKNKISTIKTQNGPVHDFTWHKSGQKFIVISGFMPATIRMFSKQNEPLFQFGKRHRNTIVWGNLGRFVCLAGFGNLNGEMEIWDLQTLKQIGYCKSSSASYCQWSLDDRKLITAIVTPRLRVDNCYRIYSYTGKELSKIGYQQTQLYGAYWLKSMKYQGQPRGLSPGRKIQIQPKKQQGKFKSFASAMNFGSLTFNEKVQEKQKPKLAPGQFPDDEVHKKKRKRKNKEVEQLAPS